MLFKEWSKEYSPPKKDQLSLVLVQLFESQGLNKRKTRRNVRMAHNVRSFAARLSLKAWASLRAMMTSKRCNLM